MNITTNTPPRFVFGKMTIDLTASGDEVSFVIGSVTVAKITYDKPYLECIRLREGNIDPL